MFVRHKDFFQYYLSNTKVKVGQCWSLQTHWVTRQAASALMYIYLTCSKLDWQLHLVAKTKQVKLSDTPRHVFRFIYVHFSQTDQHLWLSEQTSVLNFSQMLFTAVLLNCELTLLFCPHPMCFSWTHKTQKAVFNKHTDTMDNVT